MFSPSVIPHHVKALFCTRGTYKSESSLSFRHINGPSFFCIEALPCSRIRLPAYVKNAQTSAYVISKLHLRMWEFVSTLDAYDTAKLLIIKNGVVSWYMLL